MLHISDIFRMEDILPELALFSYFNYHVFQIFSNGNKKGMTEYILYIHVYTCITFVSLVYALSISVLPLWYTNTPPPPLWSDYPKATPPCYFLFFLIFFIFLKLSLSLPCDILFSVLRNVILRVFHICLILFTFQRKIIAILCLRKIN